MGLKAYSVLFSFAGAGSLFNIVLIDIFFESLNYKGIILVKGGLSGVSLMLLLLMFDDDTE